MAGLLRSVSHHVQGDACGQLFRHDEVEPSIAVHIRAYRAAAVEALAQSNQKTRLHKRAFTFVKKKRVVLIAAPRLARGFVLLVQHHQRGNFLRTPTIYRVPPECGIVVWFSFLGEMPVGDEEIRVAVVIKIQRQAAAAPARAREVGRRGGIEKTPVIEQQFIARAHARAMAVMFFKSIASEAHCLQSLCGCATAAGEKHIHHTVPVEIRQRQALPKRVPIGRERRRGIGEDALAVVVKNI